MANAKIDTVTLKMSNSTFKHLKAYMVADIDKESFPTCIVSIFIDREAWRFTTIRQIKGPLIEDAAILPVYRSFGITASTGPPLTQICAFTKMGPLTDALTMAIAAKDELYATVDCGRAMIYFTLHSGHVSDENLRAPSMPKCKLAIKNQFAGTKNINGTPKLATHQLLLIRLDGALHKTLYSYINKLPANAIISFHIERAVRDDQKTTGSSANITVKNDMVANKPLILKTFVPIDVGLLPSTYVIGVKNEHLKHGIFVPKKVGALDTMFISVKNASVACVDFKLISNASFLVSRIPLASAGGVTA